MFLILCSRVKLRVVRLFILLRDPAYQINLELFPLMQKYTYKGNNSDSILEFVGSRTRSRPPVEWKQSRSSCLEISILYKPHFCFQNKDQ